MSLNNIDPAAFGQAFAAAYEQTQRQKHDLPTGFTLSTNLMHGPSGVFGTLGLSQDIFSTRVRPTGLLSAIPAMGTMDVNPMVPYLTGVTDYSGSDPENVCDEPPTAGEIKSCVHTAQFGRVPGQTDELDLSALGEIQNRGEYTDLRVLNDPLMFAENPLVPNVPSGFGQVLNREVLARFLTLGVYFEDRLSRMIWTGNPTNNTAGGGYQEFPGLEILVGINKVDALTGTACPSLDSDIKDFNYGQVDGSDPNILRFMTYMWRMVNHNARTMGMMPVQWAWVMRETLFYEVTATWPCNYLTYRCVDFNLDANVSINVSGDEQVRMRDDMRNGRYLLIDGVRVPVITDDALVEATNTTDANVESGAFASDIYLIPLTVLGGRPVTFIEYFDFQGSNAAMQAVSDGNLGHHFWSDGGRFLWSFNQTRTCVNWQAIIRPRIRLLTPHLAGRVENVVYNPLQHTRDAFADQPYWVDGGLTTRTNAPSLSFEWDLA
jgi:hypothetical protein